MAAPYRRPDVDDRECNLGCLPIGFIDSVGQAVDAGLTADQVTAVVGLVLATVAAMDRIDESAEVMRRCEGLARTRQKDNEIRTRAARVRSVISRSESC